ncbi:MAG: methyltransferase domain-containing protein, partial [Candidatus Omnitrophota bacterium]|nr:methyltransferase domain-containing protein [Candidatus Omnitrophota bacterium]
MFALSNFPEEIDTFSPSADPFGFGSNRGMRFYVSSGASKGIRAFIQEGGYMDREKKISSFRGTVKGSKLILSSIQGKHIYVLLDRRYEGRSVEFTQYMFDEEYGWIFAVYLINKETGGREHQLPIRTFRVELGNVIGFTRFKSPDERDAIEPIQRRPRPSKKALADTSGSGKLDVYIGQGKVSESVPDTQVYTLDELMSLVEKSADKVVVEYGVMGLAYVRSIDAARVILDLPLIERDGEHGGITINISTEAALRKIVKREVSVNVLILSVLFSGDEAQAKFKELRSAIKFEGLLGTQYFGMAPDERQAYIKKIAGVLDVPAVDFFTSKGITKEDIVRIAFLRALQISQNELSASDTFKNAGAIFIQEAPGTSKTVKQNAPDQVIAIPEELIDFKKMELGRVVIQGKDDFCFENAQALEKLGPVYQKRLKQFLSCLSCYIDPRLLKLEFGIIIEPVLVKKPSSWCKFSLEPNGTQLKCLHIQVILLTGNITDSYRDFIVRHEAFHINNPRPYESSAKQYSIGLAARLGDVLKGDTLVASDSSNRQIVSGPNNESNHFWRPLTQYVVGGSVKLWGWIRNDNNLKYIAEKDYLYPAHQTYNANLAYIQEIHGNRGPPTLREKLLALITPIATRSRGGVIQYSPAYDKLSLEIQKIVTLHESQPNELKGLIAQYKAAKTFNQTENYPHLSLAESPYDRRVSPFRTSPESISQQEPEGIMYVVKQKVGELKEILGKELLGAVWFGSTTRGVKPGGSHDIDILLIVEDGCLVNIPKRVNLFHLIVRTDRQLKNPDGVAEYEPLFMCNVFNSNAPPICFYGLAYFKKMGLTVQQELPESVFFPGAELSLRGRPVLAIRGSDHLSWLRKLKTIAVSYFRRNNPGQVRNFTHYPVEKILESLDVKEGEVFLDLGCAPGVQVISAALREARAIGVDIFRGNIRLANDLFASYINYPVELAWIFESTDRNLQEAIDRYPSTGKNEMGWTPDVNFMIGDARKIPLESDSVNKATWLRMDAFMSDRDRKRVLRELLRVVKNGGIIYLVSWRINELSLGKIAGDMGIKYLVLEREPREDRIVFKIVGKPGIRKTSPYSLVVTAQAQKEAEQRFGKDKVLTNIEVTGFDLQLSENLPGEIIALLEVIKNRLVQLEQLLGRAPPELNKWRLVITTDLSLAQGQVAACNIATKTVYILPYFFNISQEDLTKEGLTLEQLQLKILYHELISHIVNQEDEEIKAMQDTRQFVAQKVNLATRMNSAASHLRDRVALVVGSLAEVYSRESAEIRTLLGKYPPCDKVFYEEILPVIKALYESYLSKKEGAAAPTIVLLISGEGGGGKTTIAQGFREAINKALGQLVIASGKAVTEELVAPLLFDDYILQKNETGAIDPATERPIDPLTGKPTERPLGKFQVTRFVNDMRALLRGEVIYKPVFDFSTRGRIKFFLDGEGNLKIVDGKLTIAVEIDSQTRDPYFIYEGARRAEIILDKIPLSIRRAKDGRIVVNLKGSDTIVSYDAQGNAILSIGTNARTLTRGQKLEALEAVSPAGKVFIVEGILALYDSQLCREGLSLYITGDYQARELRMIIRAAREKGRKMTEEEFVEQRRQLVRTEEIPFIRPTRKNARWVATTLTRSESIYMLYTRGELYRPVAQVREALKRFNIDYKSLVRVLKDISNSAIRLSLAAGEIENDKVGTAFKVIFIKGGVVVKIPRFHFMSAFEREFSEFYTNVLKKRLGGLMVPGTILNVSALNIHLEVDCRMIELGKVLIQNTIPTLKERLMELVKQNDMAAAQELIAEYFRVQLELARRGVIDTDPKIMEKYGLIIMDGAEQLVVVGVDGLTINSEAYDPGVYIKEGMRPVELPAALLEYYDQEAAKMPASLQELTDLYLSKGMDEAHEVADISDTQISKLQMAYIVNLVRREKIALLRKLWGSISYGQDNPFIYWLKLYLDTMYPEDTPQYNFIQALYEIILTRPGFLEGQKPQRKAVEDLMRTLPQADILDDVELYNISQDLIECVVDEGEKQGISMPIPATSYAGIYFREGIFHLAIKEINFDDVQFINTGASTIETILEVLDGYAKARNLKIAGAALAGNEKEKLEKLGSRLWLEQDTIWEIHLAWFGIKEEIPRKLIKAASNMFEDKEGVIDISKVYVHPETGEVMIRRLVTLEDYKDTVEPVTWELLLNLADAFRGKKLINISSTPQGGGVALMRHRLIDLLRLLGIDAHWYIMAGDGKVFEVTKKKIHNVLQGVSFLPL